MEVVEMLDQCKNRLGINSDYALAKELEIRPMRISGYRAGREHPDIYVCFRMAEILGESPSSIIAQVEAKNAKNEAKRLYFNKFFTTAALWITLAGASAISIGFSDSAYAAGNHAETRASLDVRAHYANQSYI